MMPWVGELLNNIRVKTKIESEHSVVSGCVCYRGVSWGHTSTCTASEFPLRARTRRRMAAAGAMLVFMWAVDG